MRPTNANAVSVLWGRVVVYLQYGVFSTSVGGVDDLLYFDYVFGVVNGVYDLKSYCMVIWDDQGGIVTYFKNISCLHIASRKQIQTQKLYYPHIATRKQDQTYKP